MWLTNLFFIISLILAVFIFCKIKKSILQDVAEIKEYLNYVRSQCPYEINRCESLTLQKSEIDTDVVQNKGDKNERN